MRTAGLTMEPDDEPRVPELSLKAERGPAPHDLDGLDPEGHEQEAPVPSLERLVAEAMTLAAADGADGPALAELVNRFWRLVPDEDLVGRTGADMVAAAADQLALAGQRLPG